MNDIAKKDEMFKKKLKDLCNELINKTDVHDYITQFDIHYESQDTNVILLSNIIIIWELLDNQLWIKDLFEVIHKRTYLQRTLINLFVAKFFLEKQNENYINTGKKYLAISLSFFKNNFEFDSELHDYFHIKLNELMYYFIKEKFVDFTPDIEKTFITILKGLNKANYWIEYLFELKEVLGRSKIEYTLKNLELPLIQHPFQKFRNGEIEIEYESVNRQSRFPSFNPIHYLELLKYLDKNENYETFISSNKPLLLYLKKKENFLLNYLLMSPDQNEIDNLLKGKFYFCLEEILYNEQPLRDAIILFGYKPAEIDNSDWEIFKNALKNQIKKFYENYVQQGSNEVSILEKMQIPVFPSLTETSKIIEKKLIVYLCKLLINSNYYEMAEVIANDILEVFQLNAKIFFPKSLLDKIKLFENLETTINVEFMLNEFYGFNENVIKTQLLTVLDSIKGIYNELGRKDIDNAIVENIDSIAWDQELPSLLTHNFRFFLTNQLNKLKNNSGDKNRVELLENCQTVLNFVKIFKLKKEQILDQILGYEKTILMKIFLK